MEARGAAEKPARLWSQIDSNSQVDTAAQEAPLLQKQWGQLASEKGMDNRMVLGGVGKPVPNSYYPSSQRFSFHAERAEWNKLLTICQWLWKVYDIRNKKSGFHSTPVKKSVCRIEISFKEEYDS